MISKFKNIASDPKLKTEIPKFLVGGGTAVLVDYVVYTFLINYAPYSLSKGISFITGAAAAFVINKFWTFKQKKKSVSEIIKFIILYLSTLLANIGVNELVLILFRDFTYVIQWAFLCATGTSTILNFIGQKWWVFTGKQARN